MRGITKDVGQFVDKIRAKASQISLLDWYSTKQYTVITAASENARDRLMPLVKSNLREYDNGARANAYITKYEMEHKSIIYNGLKDNHRVKIIDWGNRVLVVNSQFDFEGKNTFRKVFQLSQSTENINTELSHF